MNTYSFLDSNGQHQPRPPPSPSQGSVAGPQVNGAQQNGVPMANGLQSGGQQTDMNHLWAVVQQLSQLLEENKAQTQGIVNGVAAIQGRAAEEGGTGTMGIREVNGEITGMSALNLPHASPETLTHVTQQRHAPPSSRISNLNCPPPTPPSLPSPRQTPPSTHSSQTTSPPSPSSLTNYALTPTARPLPCWRSTNTTRRCWTRSAPQAWRYDWSMQSGRPD